MFLLEFCGELYHKKTTAIELSDSEDGIIVARVVLTQCQRSSVRVSDGFKNTADVVQQEAQLPQRNSASAVHVYLGWLTDRAMHRTPQNR